MLSKRINPWLLVGADIACFVTIVLLSRRLGHLYVDKEVVDTACTAVCLLRAIKFVVGFKSAIEEVAGLYDKKNE